MDSEFLRGREGWNDEYASVSAFKQHLDVATLAQEEYGFGWVFWGANERDREQQKQQYQIIALLQNFASDACSRGNYLVQFWGVVKVEGRHHHLSASNHPFSVGPRLSKGVSWYRNICRDHEYVVDVQGDDEEQQLIGCVGRAYRNKQRESTPDLRLYSTNEFPLRDDAARCRFRGYLALPLFDFDTNKYYGVLELLSNDIGMRLVLICRLDTALQFAGLRSTHNTLRLSGCAIKETMEPDRESEIKDILKFAMKTVPQLYVAQVWVPCKQCASISTNLCCMVLKDGHKWIFRSWDSMFDDDTIDYLNACQFHHLQIDVSSFHSNLCDASLSIIPLAHYAQRARMSHCLAISLQSLNSSDQLYHIQFFLHPKPTFREDAYGDDALHLLLRIMEINLKTFKVVSGGQLVEESLVQSRQPNAIEYAYKKNFSESDFSESDFTAYLGTADISCLRPYDDASSEDDIEYGWVFCLPVGERLCENNINSNPLLVPVPIKEKIKDFMMKISVDFIGSVVQFWTPKMVGGRCYLETVDWPYAVKRLSKGLASFRKKCTSHSYCVDDEAEEDELGPPGRVFRNGHSEFTPDLMYYTKKEFSIRNYAMHFGNRGYLALPIFDDDEHNHKCVGVLEFLGFEFCHLDRIGRKLKKASNLCSSHFGFPTRFLANEQAANDMFNLDQTIYCRIKALTEVNNALKLIYDGIPQLHKAYVWVPNGECVRTINSNMTCLELALSTDNLGNFMPTYPIHQIHVQTRKGMVGMVLASENKSCFCRNLCEFSIVDQPLSHYEMRDRRDVCFVICLQSSRTGNLVYVVEFFLYQGPATYEYVRSFLNFLLPIMKHELKSFKMASGKPLGEELVVEVIEFSDANKLVSSGSEETEDVFPIKFKRVQYSWKERQHTEELQTKECSVAASDSKTRKRGKRKTLQHLSLDVIKQHFGKRSRKEAAEALGVSISTLKRACRDCNIRRWPNKETYKKNPSLFEREDGRDSQQDTRPSTSSLLPLDRNTESTHDAIVGEEAEKVMIKVKHEKYFIKFELCLLLGSEKLFEEVATRVKLEIGTFQLTYLDEDNDEIVLANIDADLQLCWKSHIAMDKTYIQLFVRL